MSVDTKAIYQNLCKKLNCILYPSIDLYHSKPDHNKYILEANWDLFDLVFKCHLTNEAFSNMTCFHHLNTGLDSIQIPNVFNT